MFKSTALLLAAVLVSATPTPSDSSDAKGAYDCKIIWDGRVPHSYTPKSLTKNSSIFNPTEFYGQNQTWADIVQFPKVPPSLFDKTPHGTAKPILVTISNASIYFHDPTFPETGFRRTELVPSTNNGTDATTEGTTTVHWSIRTDPSHPLNYTHEYQTAWQERNDLGGDHFALKTGTPFNPAKEDINITDPKTLRIVGLNVPTPELNAFITEFSDNTWHNFAVTIGWTNNQTTVYYSKNYAPLQKVAGPFGNDFSDQGLYHFGFLKLPIGPPDINIANQGYQEPIKSYEGLIFGGMFIEDSSNGCVTLS